MSKKYLKLFVQAIIAGFTIGLGGTVYLRIKDSFAGGMVVGSFMFAIGLFIICTRGYALFTGRACALFDNKPSYLIDLAIIWVGNLVGGMLIAGLESLTSLCGESGINAAAAALVENKMNANYLSLFCLGILCNIFIFIAVNGYAKNPHELGKYLAILFGVSCFILAGTEHCIADQYYWCISGILYKQPLQSLGCLLVITLGNMAGGVLFPLTEKLIAWLDR